MQDLTEGRLRARDQLWSQLTQTTASILWVEGSGVQQQLLPHRAEPGRETVWFIAPKTQIAHPTPGDGAWAAMTVASTDQTFFATVKGKVAGFR